MGHMASDMAAPRGAPNSMTTTSDATDDGGNIVFRHLRPRLLPAPTTS